MLTICIILFFPFSVNILRLIYAFIRQIIICKGAEQSMNNIPWIGKTDTPRLISGPNGEGSSDIMKESSAAIAAETNSILFRKEFILPAQPVRADVCVCGLGFYHLTLDGCKVGDEVLTPFETAYRKRVLYDITDLLTPGAHVIGVELGNGRYSTPNKYWDWRSGWHGDPCLMLKLHIRYADGHEETIATCSDWKCAYGPFTRNCYYDGEVFDAHLLQPGWDNALPVAAPGGVIEENTFHHIRKMRTLKPAPSIATTRKSTGCTTSSSERRNPR